MRSFKLSAPWRFALSTLAYFATIQAGFWTRGAGETVAPVWPAVGLAIWLVIRFGGLMIPAIVLGELAANLLSPSTRGLPPILVLLRPMTIANALTAMLGAWIYRRVLAEWRERLGDFSEAVAIVASAVTAPLVAATIGTEALRIAQMIPPTGPGRIWLTWWTSDVAGILLVLPVLLLATSENFDRVRRAPVAELRRSTVALFMVIAVPILGEGRIGPTVVLFGLFPLLLVAAAWFGDAGARLSVLMVAGVGIVAAKNGRGPLITGNVSDDLLNVQLFLSALAVVALVLPPIHARVNLLGRRALVLLLSGWAVSSGLFAFIQWQQDRADAASFAQLTGNAQAEIERRIQIYVDALRAGAAYLRVAPPSQAQWTGFVEGLDLKARYPGITGLGVIYPTPAGEGGSPGDRLVITTVAPAPLKPAPVGMDIRADPVRGEAAEEARDAGAPRMSRTFLMDVAGVEPELRTVILYFPVYRPGAPLATVAERRTALLALVDAPFVLDRFFAGALGTRAEKARLHVFEGGQVDASRLVYATNPTRSTLPEFSRVLTLDVFGRTFTTGWSVGPGFVRTSPSPVIWLAVSLAVATLLLTGWVISLQTYRDRAEAMVADRTAALRESEARHRAVIEWTPAAILVHRGGEIVFANPASARMLGAESASLLIGKEMRSLFPRGASDHWLEGTGGADQRQAAVPIETRLIRFDGSMIDAEVSTTAIGFDGVPAFHSSIHDLTARKQAERARVSLEAQLRRSQRLEAIGTLSGGIAHDFNNLLAAVLGNVEVALFQIKDSMVVSERLEEIRRAAFRGRDLVTQVLSFSHPQPAERAAIHLAPIVQESTRFVRATLPEPVVVEAACEPDVPRVLANGLQIQRLVINLATNASQAMRNGAGRIDIRLDSPHLDDETIRLHPELSPLRAKGPARLVRLTVRDNGCGMDATTLERIFEPFFTTRATGSGTGLGLAVVHGIVQTHEGVILVDSQPGQGTVFAVWLRAAPGGMGA